MPRIDAATDPGVVVLDRLGDGLDLRVAMARPVVVDADGDPVILDQPIDGVERRRIGIGGNVFQAHGLGEVEDPAVGILILGQANDTVADDLDVSIVELALERVDRFRAQAHRHVGWKCLPEMQAELLGDRQRFLHIGPPVPGVTAKRVALQSHLEWLVRTVAIDRTPLNGRRQPAQGDRAGGGAGGDQHLPSIQTGLNLP